MTLGPVVIAHWSKSQATVALSSGEAEFNGMIKCLVESVSIWNLMQEIWDMEAKIIAYADASACRSMLLRSDPHWVTANLEAGLWRSKSSWRKSWS